MPFLARPQEFELSAFVKELGTRDIEAVIVRLEGIRSIALPELRAVFRVHRFMKMYDQRTTQITSVDAMGVATLPFSVWRSMAHHVLYRTAMEIELLSQAIRSERPEVVIFTSRSRRQSAASGLLVAGVARSLGVPSMWLQVTELPQGEDLAIIQADRFMVLGEAYKERFVEAGTPAEHIEIVGSDHCAGGRGPDRQEARARVARELGLDLRNDKLVLFASQKQGPERNPSSYRRLVFASVAEAVKAQPRTRLVVKLHPQETATGVAEVFADCLDRDRFEVVHRYDLDMLLEASDAVLIQWSTVGLQAIARQKPVIVLHYKDGEPEVDLPAEGAALCVNDPSLLADSLGSVLWDEAVRDKLHANAKRFVERHMFTNDGRAWERVADAIDKLR